MKSFRKLFLPILIVLLGSFPGISAGQALKITEMAVTTKIVRGNPIDSVHRISSNSVKALYCFTRLVSDSEEEGTIKHIWYKDGTNVAEYQLPVKGEKWRTFSKKTVEKGSAGDWRVDAVDSEGKVLKSVSFRMN